MLATTHMILNKALSKNLNKVHFSPSRHFQLKISSDSLIDIIATKHPDIKCFFNNVQCSVQLLTLFVNPCAASISLSCE